MVGALLQLSFWLWFFWKSLHWGLLLLLGFYLVLLRACMIHTYI
jgi:hypothetical protein